MPYSAYDSHTIAFSSRYTYHFASRFAKISLYRKLTVRDHPQVQLNDLLVSIHVNSKPDCVIGLR